MRELWEAVLVWFGNKNGLDKEEGEKKKTWERDDATILAVTKDGKMKSFLALNIFVEESQEEAAVTKTDPKDEANGPTLVNLRETSWRSELD